MFTNIPSDKLCIRSKPQSITSFQFISRINMYNGNCQGKVIIFKMLTKKKMLLRKRFYQFTLIPEMYKSHSNF